ncbi:MAG: HNH endonuclease [Planctomycetia bacterium]|nr:HNH endonuclease [Planctomycetia bacterium]
MPRRNWSREETLVAFNVYCRTPFGKLHARNPEIIEVATAIGRTPGAVAMKCCNLASLDSALQARGISGLSKASGQDAEVWNEFELDPESIAFEAEQAFSNAMRQELRSTDVVEWEDVRGLDKAVVTKVRVNQHFFRSVVLAGYQSRCAVCALPFPSLLVAAHIVPWSVDKSLRMNPRNGICLCSLHERSFDKGLLLINRDYTIALHAEVSSKSDIESVAANFSRFLGRKLTLPDRWHPDPELLERHIQLVTKP